MQYPDVRLHMSIGPLEEMGWKQVGQVSMWGEQGDTVA